MLVYGDPGFEARATDLLGGLRARIAAAIGDPNPDRLRALPIEAGQIEQAVADSPDAAPALASVMAAADAAAEALLAGPAAAADHLCRAAGSAAAAAVLVPPKAMLRVKTPEGYACYNLYPEQYAAAAKDWAARHSTARPGPVAVVGLRSIGTSLSAMVSAALRAAGWRTQRLTVRPLGHPFDRQAEIARAELGSARLAIVVDEGPGLSGSSMAAAGAALEAAGLPSAAISAFPGHPHEPGHAASDRVRRWWAGTPRFWADPEASPLFGYSLAQALRERTARLAGTDHAEPPEPLGGGRWRAAVWPQPRHWPAVATTLERTKYRITTARGRILWKFGGLAIGPDGRSGADVLCDRLRALADAGWSPPPLGQTLGFVAMPWLEGERLHRVDADPPLLNHVGRYLAAAAGPTLERQEYGASFARLISLLTVNTREALGAGAERRAAALARLSERTEAPLRSAEDGHMAPYEWLRTTDGRLLKLDAGGHDADHTLIGPQPLDWDLAGTLVEWRLTPAAAAPLLEAAHGPRDQQPPAFRLAFYSAAYAAFRIGLCAITYDVATNPAERTRLARARARYTRALGRILRSAAPRHQPITT